MPIPARPHQYTQLPAGIFREYDIRGIADKELLSPGIRTLGQAIGTYLIRRFSPKVNLARDCRLTSDRLHDALLDGLLAAGCEVTDLGVVPTPLLYYSVFHLKADGGVMITGSHNPPDYNGFKVMHGKSTIHGEEIQQIRELVESGDFETGAGHLDRLRYRHALCERDRRPVQLAAQDQSCFRRGQRHGRARASAAF